MLPAGGQTHYLFPDTVLIFEGSQVGAVGYDQLELDVATVNFVEDGPPPSGSRRVGTTWRFVNKNGTPDRRFRENREQPMME